MNNKTISVILIGIAIVLISPEPFTNAILAGFLVSFFKLDFVFSMLLTYTLIPFLLVFVACLVYPKCYKKVKKKLGF